jgi:precorrin-6B methylase 1
VHVVQQPENLGRPLAKIAPVHLEGHEPSDVHLREVHRRVAVDDPVGDRPARAATGLESHGVEARRHEVAAQLGSLAEDVAIVRREALGAVEEQPDAHVVEQREPAGGHRDERRQVVPVLG